MAKIATKLEDIGDERDQAVFMATVELWFDGNFQAALDHYNKMIVEDEELMKKKAESKAVEIAEVNLRFHS